MEFISRSIAQFILFIASQTEALWQNIILLNVSYPQVILDILLVSIFFYYVFVWIRGTRAAQILIGLSIVAVVFFVSRILELVTLEWLLDRFLTVLLVAIPVLFQQELRMGLERLGNTKFEIRQKEKSIDWIVTQLVMACEILAKKKQGALIVLRHMNGLREYVETGIPLDAKISKEIVLSIFNHSSPLHDGAIIIDEGKIKAASCLLPHALKSELVGVGTRHKAAVGLSELTDAGIIVVSEEKGVISFASKGLLKENINSDTLRKMIIEILQPPKKKKKLKPHPHFVTKRKEE